MSKSLGNLVMVNDLLQDWSPNALRVYLACHHYRQPWSHDPRELEQSERLAQKLQEAVNTHGGFADPIDPSSAREAFMEAMEDDLNTPHGIEALERLAEKVLAAAVAGQDVEAAQESLRSMGRVFGLRLGAEEPEECVKTEWQRFRKDFA
jgi:cysteinyl-tRNA synthetase